MGNLSDHFSSSEFACKDQCGWRSVDPLLVLRLEALRARLGRPLTILSGRRCPVHNGNVKGALRSRHVYGDAADLYVSARVKESDARAVGFTGIGINRSGYVTHVDVRPQRTVTVWKYP